MTWDKNDVRCDGDDGDGDDDDDGGDDDDDDDDCDDGDNHDDGDGSHSFSSKNILPKSSSQFRLSPSWISV